jgi:hypothetical protein
LWPRSGMGLPSIHAALRSNGMITGSATSDGC